MVKFRTLLEIQANESYVKPYSTKIDKWGYMIGLGGERNFKPLMICEATYNSESEAQKRGDFVLERIKRARLIGGNRQLEGLLS